MKQTKIITLLILAFFLGGCGSDKKSEPEATLSVTPTEIILSSSANANQIINIQCNSSWTVSGTPDWLQISSISGNGNSSIVITARTANESSNSRSANLLVNAGEKSQVITVQQESGLSSCKAVPSNVTSLYYTVVFNLSYSSEVALTKILLISDYDFKHKTDKEVIAAVENQSSEIPEDETIYIRAVDENTKYHILSLSYDRQGNRGELVDVIFDSPKFYSATDDAWCTIENPGIDTSNFWFDVVKKGRCATYDVIYGANIPPSYLSGSLMAFELNYYLTNKKRNWLSENLDLYIETSYPNDHTFSCKFNPALYYGGVIVTTWGVFSDGRHSSDITTLAVDLYSDDVISPIAEKNNLSEIEWIRNQKDWIKFSPKDLK